MERPLSVHVYDPPRQVWVRTRELLPIGVHDLAEGDPEQGLRIEHEAPGVAHESIRRADAGRLLLVSYPLWTGDREHQHTVTHWVPVQLVRRRHSATKRGGPIRHDRRTHG